MSACTDTLDGINAGALPPMVYPPPPPTPVILADKGVAIGKDCAGADLPPVPVVGAVQTVPHPTAVQLVKLCEPQKDYEVERACNAAGEPVMVQYDAGVVPPVELSRTNMLTGAPEPAGTLRKCDGDEIELVDLVACLNGVEIVGVAVMTDKDLPVMTGELWRDPTTGAWGALPAGAVIGACPAVIPDRKVLIYLERNGGVVSMADIIAAVGGDKVQSVTVKQISGRGTVKADAGSGVPLDTGETWSWSAITGSDAWDYLGASALSMDAGSGEQRITATYIL